MDFLVHMYNIHANKYYTNVVNTAQLSGKLSHFMIIHQLSLQRVTFKKFKRFSKFTIF